MEKQIPIIALAVFFVSILLFQTFATQPAYAQSFVVISPFNYGIKGMSYQADSDSIWVLSAQTTGAKTWLYQVDRSTQSIIFSFNHTAQFSSLSLGWAEDIWCGKTDCFITTNTSTGGCVARISTETLGGGIFKGENVTGTQCSPVGAGYFKITGRDQVSGGFGSITLWVDGCSEAAATCDGQVRVIDGISMLIAFTFGAYNSANQFAVKVHEMEWSGISGSDDNDLVTTVGFVTDTAAHNRLIIYNLATLTVKCNVATPATNNTFGLDTNYLIAGSTNNKIYVGSIDGQVYVYNDSCILQQTIPSSFTGLTGDIRYVQYESGRVFIQETGANARIVQLLTNSTGHILTNEKSTYLPLPSTSQSAFDSADTSITTGNMILFAGNGKLWFPYTGDTASDKKIGILTYQAVGGGVGGGGNAENGRCGVGTALDCVGDRSLINKITGGTDVAVVGGDLFCGVGLNATCSGDIKTNGTGLLLMLMTGSFFAGLVFLTIGAANTKFGAGIAYTEIPKEFWLFLVVGVVSFAFYMQWIPDIVFYGMMVGLAGLFSFGLYKHIRGG